MKKQEVAQKTLKQLMEHFDPNSQIDIQIKDGDIISISLKGDKLSNLIGFRGQALDALADIMQHIIYAQTEEWPNLELDINGYNEKRVERLQNLAKRFIDRVRFFQNEVEMPFLNPWERKQIHSYINEYDDVISESRGEGKTRRLYLLPKSRNK